MNMKIVIHADGNAEDCHVATALVQNSPRSNLTAATFSGQGNGGHALVVDIGDCILPIFIIGSQFQSWIVPNLCGVSPCNNVEIVTKYKGLQGFHFGVRSVMIA